MLCVSVVHSFLLLSSIPLQEYIIICLSIHLIYGFLGFFSSSVWNYYKVPWTFEYKCLYTHILYFSWVNSLGKNFLIFILFCGLISIHFQPLSSQIMFLSDFLLSGDIHSMQMTLSYLFSILLIIYFCV